MCMSVCVMCVISKFCSLINAGKIIASGIYSLSIHIRSLYNLLLTSLSFNYNLIGIRCIAHDIPYQSFECTFESRQFDRRVSILVGEYILLEIETYTAIRQSCKSNTSRNYIYI